MTTRNQQGPFVEASTILNVPPRTLARLVTSGALSPARHGDRYVFDGPMLRRARLILYLKTFGITAPMACRLLDAVGRDGSFDGSGETISSPARGPGKPPRGRLPPLSTSPAEPRQHAGVLNAHAATLTHDLTQCIQNIGNACQLLLVEPWNVEFLEMLRRAVVHELPNARRLLIEIHAHTHTAQPDAAAVPRMAAHPCAARSGA